MKERGVYLGGEGRNELGSRIGSPIYQSDAEPGVIEESAQIENIPADAKSLNAWMGKAREVLPS